MNAYYIIDNGEYRYRRNSIKCCTSTTLDEEKDNATPTLGLVLVIADGNAKAGVGNMEANGERFLYNSPFLNIRIYIIYTWTSPNNRDQNQIDPTVTGRYRRFLLDTRVMRGADIGGDHHFLNKVRYNTSQLDAMQQR